MHIDERHHQVLDVTLHPASAGRRKYICGDLSNLLFHCTPCSNPPTPPGLHSDPPVEGLPKTSALLEPIQASQTQPLTTVSTLLRTLLRSTNSLSLKAPPVVSTTVMVRAANAALVKGVSTYSVTKNTINLPLKRTTPLRLGFVAR